MTGYPATPLLLSTSADSLGSLTIVLPPLCRDDPSRLLILLPLTARPMQTRLVVLHASLICLSSNLSKIFHIPTIKWRNFSKLAGTLSRSDEHHRWSDAPLRAAWIVCGISIVIAITLVSIISGKGERGLHNIEWRVERICPSQEGNVIHRSTSWLFIDTTMSFIDIFHCITRVVSHLAQGWHQWHVQQCQSFPANFLHGCCYCLGECGCIDGLALGHFRPIVLTYFTYLFPLIPHAGK